MQVLRLRRKQIKSTILAHQAEIEELKQELYRKEEECKRLRKKYKVVDRRLAQVDGRVSKGKKKDSDDQLTLDQLKSVAKKLGIKIP